jgi:hypothetical protein
MTAEATRLEADLDAIHAALRAGHLHDLGALTQALEATMSEVEHIDALALTRVRSKAARNASALIAAGSGVRSAVRRLAEIRAVQDGFVSYGPAGARDETATPRQLTQRF